MFTPSRLVTTALKVARSAGDALAQCEAVTALISAPSPTVSRTLTSSVILVERSERNFVHSELKTRAWVTFIPG